MARKEEGPGFNPLGWMFTFSDLVTLLLTFFVMLLSMKEPEVQKLKDIFGVFEKGSTAEFSVSDKAKVQGMRQMIQSIRPPSIEDITSQDQMLARELEAPPSNEALLQGLLQKGIKVKSDARGLVITLANDLMFKKGSAELSPDAKQAIGEACVLLKHGRQAISVEGNTDNTPPRPGSPYPDNWSLSLARAEAVLQVLLVQEKLTPSRLRVAALGDTRPLAPNDSPEHRAMNRRTEIVLLMNQEQ